VGRHVKTRIVAAEDDQAWSEPVQLLSDPCGAVRTHHFPSWIAAESALVRGCMFERLHQEDVVHKFLLAQRELSAEHGEPTARPDARMIRQRPNPCRVDGVRRRLTKEDLVDPVRQVALRTPRSRLNGRVDRMVRWCLRIETHDDDPAFVVAADDILVMRTAVGSVEADLALEQLPTQLPQGQLFNVVRIYHGSL